MSQFYHHTQLLHESVLNQSVRLQKLREIRDIFLYILESAIFLQKIANVNNWFKINVVL